MATRDKRDAQRARLQELFLEALGQSPSVTKACEAAQVGRNTAYRWRDEYPEFADRWDDIKAAGIERLEDALYQRAIDTSDQAAMFLLKALKPHVYRDQQRVEHVGDGGGPVRLEGLDSMPLKDKRVLLGLLERASGRADDQS